MLQSWLTRTTEHVCWWKWHIHTGFRASNVYIFHVFYLQGWLSVIHASKVYTEFLLFTNKNIINDLFKRWTHGMHFWKKSSILRVIQFKTLRKWHLNIFQENYTFILSFQIVHFSNLSVLLTERNDKSFCQ